MTDTWLIWCLWPCGYSEPLRGLNDQLVTFETQGEAEAATRELEISDCYAGKYIARRLGSPRLN